MGLMKERKRQNASPHRDCCSGTGSFKVWCNLSNLVSLSTQQQASVHFCPSVSLSWWLCYLLPFFLSPPSFSLTDSASSVLCLDVPFVHFFISLSVSFLPFLSTNFFECAPSPPRESLVDSWSPSPLKDLSWACYSGFS